MGDRELLVMAAKAAGVEVAWNEYWQCFQRKQPLRGLGGDRHAWVPLGDDGDALRLAVALDLSVMAYPFYSMPKHAVIVKQYRSGDAMRTDNPTEVVEPYGDDANAATRRAIVKSAAEIGRSSNP